jgi:hypothetical protein
MKHLLLVLLLPALTYGQSIQKDNWSVSGRFKLGFLAAHRGTMGHLSREHLYAGEISIFKQLRSKPWSKSYNNPFAGFTLYGSNLGNEKVLGYGFGAYSFIEIPFRASERFIVSPKVGAGIGFVTKVFNQQSNPKNTAVSSYVNALINLGIHAKLFFKQRNSISLGIDLTHFSNGSSKVPNLGLNMPFVSLAYAYQFTNFSQVESKETFQRVPFFKNWSYSIIGIVSEKQIFPTGGKRYPVFAISNFIYKQFRPKVGMEIALDIISKQSIFAYRTYIPKNQWRILQIGAYLGYNLPLDRFRFVLGMGVYLKDRYDQDNELYHRVGMRYQFDNGLLLNLVLKSHWAKADYVEYGIGYTFNYKRRYHE